MQPDDLGRLFARIDDRQHPAYPGLALALMTGNDPVVVHRTHYFEDVQFIDCFSPHPDHAFLPPAEEQVKGIGPLLAQLEAAKGGKLTIAQWFIHKGDAVRAGGAAARIEQVPPDNRTVHLRMPVDGKTSYIGTAADELGRPGSFRIPLGVLYRVKHYGADGAIDPFVELRAACAALLKPAAEARPLPPQRKSFGLWVSPLGAGCIVLSALIFVLQFWLFWDEVHHGGSPLAAAIANPWVYFGLIWGGTILGGILLGRHLKRPGFPAWALTVLAGCCLIEAVVFAIATWWMGTIYAGASFVTNVVNGQLALQIVLWPPVVLGFYWLWFRRVISRQRAVSR